MIMPFTYSITNGIGFGFITYTLICAARRERKQIHPFMWIVSAAFVLYFLVPVLQRHVGVRRATASKRPTQRGPRGRLRVLGGLRSFGPVRPCRGRPLP